MTLSKTCSHTHNAHKLGDALILVDTRLKQGIGSKDFPTMLKSNTTRATFNMLEIKVT